MRTIIIILILATLVILVGIWTGFIDVNQTRQARAPDLSATSNGVVAKGGRTPAFDVETGSVSVGAKDAQVKVPSLQVNKPAEPQPETANAQ